MQMLTNNDSLINKTKNLYKSNTLSCFEDIFDCNFENNYEDKINWLRLKSLYKNIFEFCCLKYRIVKIVRMVKILKKCNNKYLNVNFFKNNLKVNRNAIILLLLKILNRKILFNKKSQKLNQIKEKCILKIILNKHLQGNNIKLNNIINP